MMRLRFACRVSRARRVWTGLLLASVLAQVFLPLQSHSRWAIAGDGRVVQLCTLDGMRTVHIDADGHVVGAQQQDVTRSAALAFSDLLFHAVPTDAALPAGQAERHGLPMPVALLAAPQASGPQRPIIRGPPADLT